MDFVLNAKCLYLIRAVNKDYNDNIIKVNFVEMNNNKINFDISLIATKEQVINLISQGFIFKTYYINKSFSYVIGPKVHVFKERFLRTDETEVEEDNLDNLQQF